jgi:hypothetical protein
MKDLRQARHLFAECVDAWAVDYPGKHFKGELLELRRLLGRRIPAILQQMMVQIDFDRADLRAGTAQRTGVG